MSLHSKTAGDRSVSFMDTVPSGNGAIHYRMPQNLSVDLRSHLFKSTSHKFTSTGPISQAGVQQLVFISRSTVLKQVA